MLEDQPARVSAWQQSGSLRMQGPLEACIAHCYPALQPCSGGGGIRHLRCCAVRRWAAAGRCSGAAALRVGAAGGAALCVSI